MSQPRQTEHNVTGTDNDKVILGKINGFYGIKGYVKVFSETRPKEAILSYQTLHVCIKNEWKILQVLDAKPQAKNLVFLFEGYTDRTAAMPLLGAMIAVTQSELPKLAQNEYFWRDLIGMTVVNTEGVSFGIVKSMIETGANDVLVCHDGLIERLVPFTQGHAVVSVDLILNSIVVDWDADF